jgi:hypothetical protein
MLGPADHPKEGTMATDLRDLRDDGRMTSAEHDRRMAAARARASYELGDSSWAGVILAAYLNPDADGRALAEELGT